VEGVGMSIAKKLIENIKEDIKPSRIKVSESYMQLVELFPLQSISTKAQYEMSLKVVGQLISYSSNLVLKDEGLEIYLKTLSELVGEYENDNFKSPEVSGREMLAYLMDLQGLNQKDLAKELGGQPIVCKILKGDRELNIRQIKALSKRFKVSPQVFI
jgi:HTH-type transcriptional regulator/antitoxin HigA